MQIITALKSRLSVAARPAPAAPASQLPPKAPAAPPAFDAAAFSRFGWRLKEDDAALQRHLGFSDKEGYFAWRALWRRALAETIAGIRQAKKDRKSGDDGLRGTAQSRREMLRVEAFNLLLLRAASKRLAGAQRAARRAAS